MKKGMKKAGKATFNIVEEFKKFVSKGSVLDMATGVIIGGAFNKIVSSLVNILLSLCTWGVPGGLKGLITVLPPANETQQPLNGTPAFFDKGELTEVITDYATAKAASGASVDYGSAAYNAAAKDVTANYVLHGNTYVYKQLAVIDWGAFINAIISFLIIALTLFFIVKAVKKVQAKNKKALDDLKNQLNEEELAAKKIADEKAAKEAEKAQKIADEKAREAAKLAAQKEAEQKAKEEKQQKVLENILIELQKTNAKKV